MVKVTLKAALWSNYCVRRACWDEKTAVLIVFWDQIWIQKTQNTHKQVRLQCTVRLIAHNGRAKTKKRSSKESFKVKAAIHPLLSYEATREGSESFRPVY